MHRSVLQYAHTIADTSRTSPFTPRRLAHHLLGPACSAKLDLKKLGPDLDLVDAAHLALFPPPRSLGGERGETTMPGPVFFNTSPACLRQPDERCRPACTNRLPAYMVRLVRLCSRHRLFTELALDTHTHKHKKVHTHTVHRSLEVTAHRGPTS